MDGVGSLSVQSRSVVLQIPADQLDQGAIAGVLHARDDPQPMASIDTSALSTVSSKLGVALAVTALAGTVTTAQAQTAPLSEDWAFSVTPYIWLPSLEGTLRYSLPPGSGSPSVSVKESSPFDALDGAFMIAGEARHGRWSLFGDYIYMKFAASDSAVRAVDFNTGAPAVNPFSTTVNRGTATQLKGHLLTLAAGYNLGAAEWPLDVIGGLRLLTIDTTSDWQLSAAIAGPGAGQSFAAAGSASSKQDSWDAIVGVRGRAKIADRWFVPYYLDMGAGASKWTWQALAGIGYAFGWGDVSLAYRHLFYDQDNDRLLQDFKFSGAMLGASFRF
jgi:hypothetical protein